MPYTSSTSPSDMSPAMQLAYACLGGKRHWKGTVRGLFGLIKRNMTITSTGLLINDALEFSEEMVFSDGEKQSRNWSISENAAGLTFVADDVTVLKEGHDDNGALVFEYRIKFGAFRCTYYDCFIPRHNGEIQNYGKVYWLGLKIMTITSTGTALA